MAIEMVANKTISSLATATEMVGAVPSTIMHRRRGRKSHEEESSYCQKLTSEEEKTVADHCYFRCRLGFPATIWQLQDIAVSVVQKRNQSDTSGRQWEIGFIK
ncbi:hypothetical protein C7212DRAFT_189609 [Tuber magnatum]|uniref:HTH CENPB-type domain-containing protein n=1 Tax=Tuber magnatum TaxID=42249 RepID=A0A317SQZ4_9PEZI|nr:hypothetical protein C7212DRAFT_189609 [Tuber magnatum]